MRVELFGDFSIGLIEINLGSALPITGLGRALGNLELKLQSLRTSEYLEHVTVLDTQAFQTLV